VYWPSISPTDFTTHTYFTTQLVDAVVPLGPYVLALDLSYFSDVEESHPPALECHWLIKEDRARFFFKKKLNFFVPTSRICVCVPLAHQGGTVPVFFVFFLKKIVPTSRICVMCYVCVREREREKRPHVCVYTYDPRATDQSA
jgi:hypothetical protein